MCAKRWIAVVSAALFLIGCGPPASKGGFDSANPAAKMYAIEYAAREGNHKAIGHLIEQLDSDDPAVRMMAISALERLTGQTMGYHQYDPLPERRQAVHRWSEAYRSGTLQIQAEPVEPNQEQRHG